jgi:hypothetical protein
MNTTRLLIAMLAVAVVGAIVGYLIHAVLLANDYNAIATLYRPAAETKYVIIVLANVIFAIGAVLAYAYGVEDKPWIGQGLRFGLILWLISSVPMFFIMYATQPIPEALFGKQLAFELVHKLILGLVTAGIYRRPI